MHIHVCGSVPSRILSLPKMHIIARTSSRRIIIIIGRPPFMRDLIRRLHPNSILRESPCPSTLDGLGNRSGNRTEMLALSVSVVVAKMFAATIGTANVGEATVGHDDESTDRGETGADDANVNFDG